MMMTNTITAKAIPAFIAVDRDPSLLVGSGRAAEGVAVGVAVEVRFEEPVVVIVESVDGIDKIAVLEYWD